MTMRMNEPRATTRKTAPPPAPARRRRPRRAPSDDDIRLRAYHFYLERGEAPGDPYADWLRAETELIAEMNARKSSRTRR